jgi:hypothetical protein
MPGSFFHLAGFSLRNHSCVLFIGHNSIIPLIISFYLSVLVALITSIRRAG